MWIDLVLAFAALLPLFFSSRSHSQSAARTRA